MINALLADRETHTLEYLKAHLEAACPHIVIKGMAQSHCETSRQIRELHPDLLFIEKNLAYETQQVMATEALEVPAAIILFEDRDYSNDFIAFHTFSYIRKPLQTQELMSAISQAQYWIRLHQEQKCQAHMLKQMVKFLGHRHVIAVPATDGFEFLKAEEIIRCEGLNKNTLIVSKGGRDLISSYNIGEFIKILMPLGFFPVHKSHLVNIQYIQKLGNDGNIRMRDGSHVPLSRRRRRSFFGPATPVKLSSLSYLIQCHACLCRP